MTPLSEFHPEVNTKPEEISFQDGEPIPLDDWTNVPPETVEWMVKERHLSAAHCPLMGTGGKVLVSTEKGDITGKSEQVGYLWVATHGSADALVRDTKRILKLRGVDLGTVRLKIRF